MTLPSEPPNHKFTITEVEEIEKDLKKIKVTNFNEAYEVFKKALPEMINEGKSFHQHYGFFPIANIQCKLKGEVYVAKKMRCRGMDGNNHFRVVFQVENDFIKIIEVYYKSHKEIEDKARICKYCSCL